MLRRLAAVVVVLFAASAASGRSIEEGGEVWTAEPRYRGRTARAPIPTWQHILNEGGSDRAGLCVIASNTADGLFQGVPEFADGKGSRVWLMAKDREGGYYPEKLERLFREAGLETAWFQAEGSADELTPIIEHYNRQGIPLGVTMNFGERYGQGIHHMVSLLHLDDEVACIVDNNFPGEFMWISRAEFERRLVDGPAGWVVVLLWGRMSIPAERLAAAGLLAIGGLALSASALAAARSAATEDRE